MVFIVIIVVLALYWAYMQTDYGAYRYNCVDAERDLKELKRKKLNSQRLS